MQLTFILFHARDKGSTLKHCGKKMIVPLSVITTVLFCLCNRSTPLTHDSNDIYESIEHAAIHMQDIQGYCVSADTLMPGTHLEIDSIDHRRIDVTLSASGNDYCGIIHFGPDLTGDILVCVDTPVNIEIVNRSAQGDKPLEIEKNFNAEQIFNSIKTSIIKNAIVFEAQKGANCIIISHSANPTVHIVIEEVAHEHD
jgi:hypothetical protein